MSTSDGLGICRKREEEKETEAARFGRKHHGFKKFLRK
jgi:hypothetical protein